jgi:hypothetical protein
MLKSIDRNGNALLPSIVDHFITFYQDRKNNGLLVEADNKEIVKNFLIMGA